MANRSPNPDHQWHRGFSVIEGLMASTVLAAAVLGVLCPLTASHQEAAAFEETSLAASLAQELMEEIAGKSFADPKDGSITLGHEANELTRASYDNIGDYHGYTDTTSALKTAGGSALKFDSTVTYTRTVTVEYRTAPAGPKASTGDFALVMVNVVSSRGQGTQVSRLLCRYPQAPWATP